MTRHDTLKNSLLGATALMATLASASAASAQDTVRTAAEQASQVEDVVVTAQLRAQDPIEVPFALTAYSGRTMQNLGIQDFEELSAFTPGFLVQNQSPNNPGFVMRGITSDSGAATSEPRVSVFQDGVSISKSRGSYVELFDVERVEIAKGPQSTLYGRGALIGAVNVIQNKADVDGFDAAARAGIGSYDYRMVELMLNAPVGDHAAIRFATRMKTRDGYVENLLEGQDYNSVDTQARLSESHDVQFAAAYWQRDVASIGVRSVTYDAPTHSFPLDQSVGLTPCVLPANATAVVTLAWSEYTSTTSTDPPATVKVTYATRPTGGVYELWRVRCGSHQSTVKLANTLAAVPQVSCYQADGTTTPCDGTGAKVPALMKLPLSVHDSGGRNLNTYDATLSGQRRQT